MDLDAIRKRAEAATPGPWFYNSYNAVASGPMTRKNHELVEAPHDAAGSPWTEDGDYPKPWKSLDREYEPGVCRVPPTMGDTATGRHAADAEFIAHARTDVPDLLAALEAAEARAARLRTIIVDSARFCTLKGCNHCKWLGNALGALEAALATHGGEGTPP